MSNLFLAIETSSRNCSIALFENANLIDCIEQSDDQYIHSEKLHVFIRDIFTRNNLDIKDLSAVGVTRGPGSYTGLRIGVSAAKGLCFPLDIPLISISSLQVLQLGATCEASFIVPVLDARRMEVFSAVYNSDGQLVRDIEAEIIDEQSFETYRQKGEVCVVGDCTAKIKAVLPEITAVETFPSARWMGSEINRLFLEKKFEDLAYFEPFYLKDFVAIKPKKVL